MTPAKLISTTVATLAIIFALIMFLGAVGQRVNKGQEVSKEVKLGGELNAIVNDKVPLVVSGKTLSAVEYASKKTNLLAKYDYTLANQAIKETYEDRVNRLNSNDLQELLEVLQIETQRRGGKIDMTQWTPDFVEDLIAAIR